jgi:hypothetical protein
MGVHRKPVVTQSTGKSSTVATRAVTPWSAVAWTRLKSHKRRGKLIGERGK